MPNARQFQSIPKLRSDQMTFIVPMDNSGGSAGGVLDAYGQDWIQRR